MCCKFCCQQPVTLPALGGMPWCQPGPGVALPQRLAKSAEQYSVNLLPLHQAAMSATELAGLLEWVDSITQRLLYQTRTVYYNSAASGQWPPGMHPYRRLVLQAVVLNGHTGWALVANTVACVCHNCSCPCMANTVGCVKCIHHGSRRCNLKLLNQS